MPRALEAMSTVSDESARPSPSLYRRPTPYYGIVLAIGASIIEQKDPGLTSRRTQQVTVCTRSYVLILFVYIQGVKLKYKSMNETIHHNTPQSTGNAASVYPALATPFKNLTPCIVGNKPSWVSEF